MRDPRPEYKEDSNIWLAVFNLAKDFKDAAFLSTIFGFRCAGGRLKKQGDALKFFFTKEQGSHEREVIKRYAKEYNDQIKKVFTDAVNII